ncbi:MAG: hypothetical protein LBC88_01070 [Spirochaetaceae bacterium]|jgi:hypothetical protein|nr:hypothetical protein [Spirochaetaceae bacterium]
MTKASKTILFSFFLLFTILSCVKNNNETIIENNYDDIINFLNKNKDEISSKNHFKGIEALYLLNDQRDFFNSRIDYLIAILKEDKIGKEIYYENHLNYIDKFSYESRDLFYSSKEIFDSYLFDLIGNEFGDIKLPLNYIKEYLINHYKIYNRLVH